MRQSACDHSDLKPANGEPRGRSAAMIPDIAEKEGER
jgi:hypothetical protein